MKKTLCDIYKSPLKDEMYLYVTRADALKRVPNELMTLFGKPILVTTMMLDEHKKLARADIMQVLGDMKEKGYYLQMPPEKESYLLDLHRDRKSHHDTDHL